MTILKVKDKDKAVLSKRAAHQNFLYCIQSNGSVVWLSVVTIQRKRIFLCIPLNVFSFELMILVSTEWHDY